MQAHVRAKHAPIVVHTQKIGKLPGTATYLQDECTLGNLLVQQPRKNTPFRLLYQRLLRVDIVVVGKRVFLIERLDDLGDVSLELSGIVRRKQQGHSAVCQILSVTGRTDKLLVVCLKIASAHRTRQNLWVPLV